MKMKPFIAIGGILVSYWAFETFKAFEPDIFPVVSNFDIKHHEQLEDSLYISGTMIKNRECKFEGLTVYDKAVKPMKPMKLLDVTFIDTPKNVYDRLEGYQSWGIWKIDPFTKNILITAKHTCSTGEVKTTLYEGAI